MASKTIDVGDCFRLRVESRAAGHAANDVAALYRGYYAELIAYLRRRLRHGVLEPEDIAQLTFARLMAWSGTDIVNAKGFLFAIAKRLIVDHHRRQMLREVGAIRGGSSEAGTDRDEITPEIVLSDREQLSAFLSALETLSAVQRDAIVLSRLEGLCYNEVAATLGISCSSVQKHVERGLAKCRRQIDRTEPSAQSQFQMRGHGATSVSGQAMRTAPSSLRRPQDIRAARPNRDVVPAVASL